MTQTGIGKGRKLMEIKLTKIFIYFGVALLLLLIFLYLTFVFYYVEYVPLQVKPETRQGYFLNDSLSNQEHFRKVVLVLDHYKERYKIKDGKIFIPLRLHMDKDLLWNYTIKAENDQFIKKIKNIDGS